MQQRTLLLQQRKQGFASALLQLIMYRMHYWVLRCLLYYRQFPFRTCNLSVLFISTMTVLLDHNYNHSLPHIAETWMVVSQRDDFVVCLALEAPSA